MNQIIKEHLFNHALAYAREKQKANSEVAVNYAQFYVDSFYDGKDSDESLPKHIDAWEIFVSE